MHSPYDADQRNPLAPKFKVGQLVAARAVPDGFPQPRPRVEKLIISEIRLIECHSIPSYYRVTAIRDAEKGYVEGAESFFEADVDYSCLVCGKQCDSAPDWPLRAVCPEHCEAHDYVYSREERRHYCNICGQDRPDDY